VQEIPKVFEGAKMPVVVLLVEDSLGDVRLTQEAFRDANLCKPVRLDNFESLVRGMNDFWLTRGKLPQQWQAN
jgi:chemotaxis family two-component system response regulator Rcp1